MQRDNEQIIAVGAELNESMRDWLKRLIDAGAPPSLVVRTAGTWADLDSMLVSCLDEPNRRHNPNVPMAMPEARGY